MTLRPKSYATTSGHDVPKGHPVDAASADEGIVFPTAAEPILAVEEVRAGVAAESIVERRAGTVPEVRGHPSTCVHLVVRAPLGGTEHQFPANSDKNRE